MRFDKSHHWWLMKDSPSLFTDLYELTMAQVYFAKGMNDKAYFEVTVRRLPENWGYFVMAGLAELEGYVREFRFATKDIEFLRTTNLFSGAFLHYLSNLKVNVKLRALPEGTVFFPNEPVLEVEGDLIHAQILESYILNILGFSIITATAAARAITAARDTDVVDFGLRRCQGPVASIRAARAGQMAGFKATSNLYAARLFDFACTGTMAHSFVEIHESEDASFRNFAELYGEKAVFLTDTYDPIEGIKKAAKAAQVYKKKGIKVAGIRIDSGDLAKLTKFARKHFEDAGVPFLKIFISGDLDEYKIEDLLNDGAEVDGIGIGTRFAVSRHSPSIDIVYKIAQYSGKEVYKTSPEKQSRPGRKTIIRVGNKFYEKDIVSSFGAEPADSTNPPQDDLLKLFETAEDITTIQNRLKEDLSRLEPAIKAIRNPAVYPVLLA
jgi:nicotinate phosphoribosyltransferase